MFGGGDGGGGGGGGQGGRGGWVGMQERWAHWMVTADSGGGRMQPGWRALDGGVLGSMLVSCRRVVLFCNAAGSAG